jgi:hypothetical protein
MTNRFAGFADNGGVPFGKYTPAKPRKPKPNSRFVDYEGVDEEGFIPNLKRENNMTNYNYDTSRDPYHAILDKMARAHQAITGDSYAKSYTAVYTDPKNSAIRDASKNHDLAKAFDGVYGTAHAPTTKAAPQDPKQDFVERAVESRGPAHAKLHEMAIEHSRAHGLSYQQSYTRLFTSPENVALRAGIAAEAGIRTLTLDEARALAPAPAFPAYSSPGQHGASNVGRSGTKPPGYAGG